MSVTNGQGKGQPLVSRKAGAPAFLAASAQRQEPHGRADDIVIGAGVSTCGTFKTAGSIFVDGVLRDATVEASLVSVSRGGELSGSITANRVEISGRLKGKAVAAEEIVLRVTAEVEGTVSAPYIVIHRGASICGETQTLERSAEDGRSAPPPHLYTRRRRAGRHTAAFSLLVAGLALGSAVWAWWG